MRRRLIVYPAAVAVFLILLIVVAPAVFCEGVMRVPRRRTGGPISGQAIEIRARDGVTLRGRFQRVEGSGGKCVMALHGIADSSAGVASFAPMFLERGYSVLLPDSRAHGESGGDLVTYGLLEKYDTLDWVRRMRAEGCAAVYGLGESLGGSVLIEAAAVEPAFRAIAAECPFADLRQIGTYRVRQMGLPAPAAALLVSSATVYARVRHGLDFRDASPVAAMARIGTPVLLIHGTGDDRTPPSHSAQLADANRKAVLWLVPGAGHVAASHADPAGFRTRVLEWFARH